MTKRTFGLLSMLSILSIGAFTAALVLAYPNPNSVDSEKHLVSDTKSIDASRSTANTNSANQSVVSGSQSPVNESDKRMNDVSARQSLSSNNTASQSAPTPQSTSTPKESNTSQQAVPAANSQPTLVSFMRDTIEGVMSLLPL